MGCGGVEEEGRETEGNGEWSQSGMGEVEMGGGEVEVVGDAMELGGEDLWV